MDRTVSIKELSGSIGAIGSKSHAHRLLIAAALSDKPTKMILNTTSEDIEATIACMQSAGAKITRTAEGLEIIPIEKFPSQCVFDCGESGSLIRFLIPVAAALGIDAVFTCHGSLPKRPQGTILKALRNHGTKTSEDNEFPIKISGQLQSGEFSLPGNISSQYATGLLFALPLLPGDSVLTITHPVESKPYIDLTVSVLREFGIEVISHESSYSIKGSQKYTSPGRVNVEGDWSNAAFFAAAGALSDVTITGLNLSSPQGDKGILDILSAMGAEVTTSDSGIRVCKKSLRGINIDASNIPDLVPVAAALAVFAQGETVISNASRLRIKESDRLETVTQLITAAGGDIIQKPDGLIIKGGKKLRDSFSVSSFNDHRIVMAATLLSFGSQVTITESEAVNKSYPEFFAHIEKLGGVVNVVCDRK